MKRYLKDRSSSARRSNSVGWCMNSIFAKSSPASVRSLGMPDSLIISNLLRNVIIKMWVTLYKPSVKCTPGNGGGQCRYVSTLTFSFDTQCFQESLESRKPGATVMPVIVSSDKTQLALFRSKCAYPIYVTIGNIPRAIRNKPTLQAQMLIGYIPTTRLKHIKNKAARRRALANLFHFCMRKVLSPIESYGVTGIAMATGDGTWYRCHPILATFIGDYPEQSLVACTPSGRCPKCLVP